MAKADLLGSDHRGCLRNWLFMVFSMTAAVLGKVNGMPNFAMDADGFACHLER